jgi:hypothetical protein
MELKELKSQYLILQKSYKLPSFKDLNENFEIDKIDKDTDYLLRAIRKLIMEKIVNSISFFDMLLNPSSVPRMYLPYVRSMSNADRKIIEEIYDKLSQISFSSLDLEIIYSEKGEANLIKLANDLWNNIKPDFSKILINIKRPSVVNIKKDKSYFG